MVRTVSKGLYWTPRVLSILFIIFLFLMSLDVISPELTFFEIALGMLMHNIPALILLIILIISWKKEIVGGIVFCFVGLLYMGMVIKSGLAWYIAISWSMTIAGPAFLIGILFIMNWIKKKK